MKIRDLSSRLCALAAALFLVALCGCGPVGGAGSGTGSSSGEQPGGATAQDDAKPQDGSSAQDAQDSDLLVYVPQGATVGEWDKECLDRHGDATAFALTELNGWQLQTLMLEQGYVWSGQDLTWVKGDGSAALLVRAADDAILTDKEIAELGHGAEESVSYRMVTSRYSSARRAFAALAGDVLEVVDVAYDDDGVVAVCFGPSMRRVLVLVTEGDDVHVLSVFGEQALQAGVFDEVAGQELGESVDAAFESLTGRAPGSAAD
jgi:hypothetical protein